MKTVFKSSEIAHTYAHQLAPFGRSPGNMSFQGDSFRSYGATICKRITNKRGEQAYLFNETQYSVTTSASQSAIRYAIGSFLPIFYIGNQSRNTDLKFNPSFDATPAAIDSHTGLAVFEYAIQQATENQKKSLAARARKETYLAYQHSWLERAKAASAFFGLRRKVDEKTIERLAAKAVKEQKRQAVEAAKREAQREIDLQAEIAAWLAGAEGRLPWNIQRCFVRSIRTYGGVDTVGEVLLLETSKGVTVPMVDAEKAFRFAVARRSKGWHRNGETFQVGDFQLDAVNEQGIIAGCHRIDWQEIERFARLQGWVS